MYFLSSPLSTSIKSICTVFFLDILPSRVVKLVISTFSSTKNGARNSYDFFEVAFGFGHQDSARQPHYVPRPDF